MPRTLPILHTHSPAIHVPPSFPPIALTPLVSEQLAMAARVGVGVSGGADSAVAAYLVAHHLQSIGYRGECVLIYSDLGMIEWRASRPLCELVAERLGLELIVVKANMIARWHRRWQDNLARYADLRCVKLIMPWSGPGRLRFCTSDEKLDPISHGLVSRFPGFSILSASGIRHDESASRKLAPICKAQSRLLRKKAGTTGWDWHPIIEWTKADVFAYHQAYGIPLHPAYTQFGCSRVSCVYCVLSSRQNLHRATLCTENHAPYRRIVQLETASAFRFQSGLWLGDIAPHLLDPGLQADLAEAKLRAQLREELEATIAPGLLYQKGWPVVIPTIEEARHLGEIRKAVGELAGIAVGYTQWSEIRDRFAELMDIAKEREAQKARKKHAA